MRLNRFIVPLVLAAAVAGCGQDNHKTQKEQATIEWTNARAGVNAHGAADFVPRGIF